MSECYECTQMDFGEDCTTAEVNYRWHGELDEDGNKVIFCDDPEDTCAWAICNCDKKLAEDLRGNERVWNLHHHQKWGDFNRDDACFPTKDRFTEVQQNIIKKTESEMEAQNGAANVAAAIAAANSNGAAGATSDSDSAAAAPSVFGDDISQWARAFGGDSVMGELNEFPEGPSLKLKLAGEFGNKNVKACCGRYPHRYPYRLGHNHACCVNETPYNVLYSECCADGSVARSGSCLN